MSTVRLFGMVVYILAIPLFASAKLYSDFEIVENEKLLDKNSISNAFLTSQTPKTFIQELIHLEQNKENFLYLEGTLFQLLNDVSYQTEQNHLNEFIQQMSDYQPKAMKLHPEGRHEVPVFNVKVRAQGVKNSWLAASSLRYYANAFEQSPEGVLVKLNDNSSKLSRPEFLGLKNSIDTMSNQTRKLVKGYLMSQYHDTELINKFAVYFALKTKDKNFTRSALNFIDTKNQQLLQRKLSVVFDQVFVVDLLIASIESKQNAKFAFSLLSPYLDKDENVQNYVVNALGDKEISASVVFVLSQTKSVKLISRLQKKYMKSSQELVKSNIKLSLMLNPLIEAKIELENLLGGELK